MKSPFLLSLSFSLSLLAILPYTQLSAQEKTKPAAAKADAVAEKAKGLLNEAKTGTEGASRSAAQLRDDLKRAEAEKIPAKDRAAIADLLKEAEKSDLDAGSLSQKMDDLLKGASPEAQKLLGASKPAPTAEPKEKPAGKQSPTGPRSFAGVEPPPVKTVKDPGSKESKQTSKALVIDADRLYMNQEKRVAIFKGNVRLRSQDLDADCEELEIIFKEGAFDNSDKTPDAADKPKEPVKDEAGASTSADEDKIDKVWLKGNGRIITIVRRSPNGDATCKSKQAIYDEVSGTLLLKEFPEAEQSGKRLVGSTAKSTITITKDMQITGENLRTNIDKEKAGAKKK